MAVPMSLSCDELIGRNRSGRCLGGQSGCAQRHAVLQSDAVHHRLFLGPAVAARAVLEEAVVPDDHVAHRPLNFADEAIGLGEVEDLAQQCGRLIERAVGDALREAAVAVDHLFLGVGVLDDAPGGATGGRSLIDHREDLEDVVADAVRADLEAHAPLCRNSRACQPVLGGLRQRRVNLGHVDEARAAGVVLGSTFGISMVMNLGSVSNEVSECQ